ncbi:MAG: hypothetical protein J5777_00345 [Clostridiales bacterium]|nr:hypothetical protein [Clostridiales bacterium]
MKKRFAAVLMTLALALTMSGCSILFPKSSLYSYEATGNGNGGNKAYTGTTVFDPSYYPYYKMLGPGGQDAYAMIYDGLAAGETSIKLKGGMSAQDVQDAFNMVLLDHPELFWVRTDFNYAYVKVTGAVTSAQFNFYDFASTPEALAKAKREFEQAAGAIINGAKRYETAAEKEVYIHDAINSACEFDANAPYSQSAYSALVKGRSVCAGYARAFQYIMQKTGIPCYYCAGTADGEAAAANGGLETSHSWNIVRTGHTYCNIDCMWDDSVSNAYGRKQYPFFNLSDREFKYHTRTGQSVNLPACNDDSQSYSKRFGNTVEVKDLIFKK